MIDIASLPPLAESAVLVGTVLVVAFVLYGVYGLLEELVAKALIDRVKGK